MSMISTLFLAQALTVQAETQGTPLQLPEILPGSEVRIQIHETVEEYGLERVETGNATGTSPSLITSSSDVASKFEAGQSVAGGASGGWATLDVSASSTTNIFYWFGAILGLAAIGSLVLLKNIRLSLILGGSSAAMIAVGVSISVYPWVWLLALVAVLGLVAFYIWSEIEKKDIQSVAKVFVDSIEDVDDDINEQVVERIEAKAQERRMDIQTRKVVGKLRG